MKTAIITDGAPMPDTLREVVQRGSTAVFEHHVDELDPARLAQMDLDRIVFWSATGDAAVRALARQYAKAEAAEGHEAMMYVVGEQGEKTAADVPLHELFVWPRDEDRLKMAFMTGG
jgi:hypothetical protein